MATDIIARGMAAKSGGDVKAHTDNNDIHVTASDKSNWNNKVDKNQGAENSGKVLGTNANGEVIPLNGYGFEYDEETKMLKYGTDPTSNLNQGIGLDNTLSKTGYAADAGAVGELKGDIALVGNVAEVELTEHTGYIINSDYIIGTGQASYSVFSFKMKKGKTYKINAVNNQLLRFGAGIKELSSGLHLNDGITSEDKSEYVYSNELFDYGFVYGKTQGFNNATFVVTEFEGKIYDKVDTIDSAVKQYITGVWEPVISEEFITKNTAINKECEINIGDKLYIEVVAENSIGNNRFITVAFKEDSTTVYYPLHNHNLVSGENSIAITLTSDVNANVIGVYVQSANAKITVKKFIDGTISKSIAEIKEVISIEDSEIIRGNVRTVGKLFKNGIHIIDSNNVPVELRGVGLHYLLQYKNLHTWESFNCLKQMGVNMIRCTVYLHDVNCMASDGETSYGYLSKKEETKEEIEKVVKLCIDLGLYVIIDWHNLDDYIDSYKTEAIEFFDYYSKKYANVPNVLYELANEPYKDNSETIANFVKDIREVILTNTSNPIMLVGQPAALLNEDGSKNWSIYDRCSALYSALSSLGITDVFVSPHNYGGGKVSEFEQCINANIPIFVSEWGNSGSDGDGDYWDLGALSQINYLHTNAIAQGLWKFTDQTMSSSLLKNFGLINSERYRRGFTENELSHNGELLLGKYKDYVTTEWIEREPIS